MALIFTLVLGFASGSFALEISTDGMLIDDLDREIQMTNVSRIISLEPAITESLYFSGHFDKLVGVAKAAMSGNWPAEVDEIESVGDIQNVNVEKVVDLKPDLILGSGMSRKGLDQLAELGYRTAYVDPESIEEVIDNLLVYGAIFNDTQQAEQEIAKLTDLLEEVEGNIEVKEPKTAIFLYNLKPVMAFGDGSIPDQVLALAGLNNVARDIAGNNPTFSIEKLLDLDPDYIFFAMRAKSGLEEMKDNPLWNELTAVKEGHCLIPPTEHVLRPTPRLIYGIYEINQSIYQ